MLSTANLLQLRVYDSIVMIMGFEVAGIKIRAKEYSGMVTVKALMRHPMESGRRKDKKSGKIIPAHYISTVKVTSGDKTLLTADWTGSISKNPYLSFKFKGVSGDPIKLEWEDSKGESDSAEATIK